MSFFSKLKKCCPMTMYKKWFKILNHRYFSSLLGNSESSLEMIGGKKLWDLLQWRNQFYIDKSKVEMEIKIHYLDKFNIYIKMYGPGELISSISISFKSIPETNSCKKVEFRRIKFFNFHFTIWNSESKTKSYLWSTKTLKLDLNSWRQSTWGLWQSIE